MITPQIRFFTIYVWAQKQLLLLCNIYWNTFSMVSSDSVFFSFSAVLLLEHVLRWSSLPNCISLCLLNKPISWALQMSLSKARSVYDGNWLRRNWWLWSSFRIVAHEYWSDLWRHLWALNIYRISESEYANVHHLHHVSHNLLWNSTLCFKLIDTDLLIRSNPGWKNLRREKTRPS